MAGALFSAVRGQSVEMVRTQCGQMETILETWACFKVSRFVIGQLIEQQVVAQAPRQDLRFVAFLAQNSRKEVPRCSITRAKDAMISRPRGS